MTTDANDFDPLEGLLCLWAWDGINRAWGLSATIPDTGRGCCDHWLYAAPEPGPGEDAEDMDPEPIPGRMVTGWSVGRGVGLVEICPPAATPGVNGDAIGEFFGSHPRVWELIRDGHAVYCGTIDAVKKAFAAWKGTK